MTRMTENLLGSLENVGPENVSPLVVLVVLLASQNVENPEIPTGAIFDVGAGSVKQMVVMSTVGCSFEPGFTADDIRAKLPAILYGEGSEMSLSGFPIPAE